MFSQNASPPRHPGGRPTGLTRFRSRVAGPDAIRGGTQPDQPRLYYDLRVRNVNGRDSRAGRLTILQAAITGRVSVGDVAWAEASAIDRTAPVTRSLGAPRKGYARHEASPRLLVGKPAGTSGAEQHPAGREEPPGRSSLERRVVRTGGFRDWAAVEPTADWCSPGDRSPAPAGAPRVPGPSGSRARRAVSRRRTPG